METFKTKDDNQDIEIIIKTSSDAVMTGPNKIFMTIYNEASSTNWRKVIVDEIKANEEFKAVVKKSRLKKRPIIRIKSKYAADSTDLKEAMAKTTKLTYDFDENSGSIESFATNYKDNKDEYHLGSSNDETFSVVKRIKVILI